MIEYRDYKKISPSRFETIRIYDEEAFKKMRQVCRLTAICLDQIYSIIRPGITTNAINDFVVDFAAQHNLIAAPLNYHGFPKSVCTSVNHVVCHGIPDERVLKEGDIINVDITYLLNGWYGDSSRMYAVGKINRAAERLIEVTHESLMRAIKIIKPGIHLGDIGEVIQSYAELHHYSVVKDFCGHGIGQLFHDFPNILHFGKKGEGIEIKKGMIFTIEPMINIGKPSVKILKDGWTAVTRDRSLSAQYEHTIGVTEDGCEVFTCSPANIFF